MAGYRRYKKDSEVSYALGITLTFELLYHKAGYVTKVYIHSECRQGEALKRLTELCGKYQIEMVYTDKIFHVLSQKENCYVIGEFKKFEETLKPDKSHVVLVGPSNAGNMGTIMRSAVGFGINQLAVIRPAVDIFDPKTIRASMGAIFQTDYAYYDTFEEYCRANGDREHYPFMLDASSSLHEAVFGERFSLIFGNEASGLPEEFSKIGNTVVIPHTGDIDSLNLPVAVSIAMYEATKGRFRRGKGREGSGLD